jgi:hypothetical protein
MSRGRSFGLARHTLSFLRWKLREEDRPQSQVGERSQLSPRG